MIKVLHVVSGNDSGGGAVHVLKICKCSKDLIKSSICCIGRGWLYDEALMSEIDTYILNFEDAISGKIAKLINDGEYDIINFHGAKCNFIYNMIYKKVYKPCTVTVHSDYRYDFLNNKFKHMFFTPLSKRGLMKFRYYICASCHIRDVLDKNNFKGNKFVVGNGIDIENYKPYDTALNMRKSLGITENDFVYIMVARMHPVKNHINLFKAFSKLAKEYNDVKLLLVGGGELEKSLIAEAKKLGIYENTIFTGQREDVCNLINSSNISILTSFSEGGAPPLVILESAAAGKPVICSNVGDMPYIVKSDCGYLVEPHSPEDIYFKMKLAYLNKNKLDDMGRNLLGFVKENYSMEIFWNKYYKAYKEILDMYKKNSGDI